MRAAQCTLSLRALKRCTARLQDSRAKSKERVIGEIKRKNNPPPPPPGCSCAVALGGPVASAGRLHWFVKLCIHTSCISIKQNTGVAASVHSGRVKMGSGQSERRLRACVCVCVCIAHRSAINDVNFNDAALVLAASRGQRGEKQDAAPTPVR